MKKNSKRTMLPMNLQLFADDISQPQAQQNNQLLDAIRGIQSQLSAVQQQPQQKTAEQAQAEQEALLEEFNSNPYAVLNKFQTQAQEQAMKGIQPMMQELSEKINNVTWSDSVRKFVGSNPNAKAYGAMMNEILRTNPEMANLAKKDPMQALNLTYSQALAQTIAPNGNVVEGVMGNEEILNQILSNPDIKKRMIDEYTASLNTGEQLPPVAGNGMQASSIAPTPTNGVKSIKEASQAAMAYMNQQNNSQ